MACETLIIDDHRSGGLESTLALDLLERIEELDARLRAMTGGRPD